MSKLEEIANAAKELIWQAHIPPAWRHDLYGDVVLELCQRQQEDDLSSKVGNVVGKHVQRWKRATERDENMREELAYMAFQESRKEGYEEAIQIMNQGLEALPERTANILMQIDGYRNSRAKMARLYQTSPAQIEAEHKDGLAKMRDWMRQNGVESLHGIL